MCLFSNDKIKSFHCHLIIQEENYLTGIKTAYNISMKPSGICLTSLEYHREYYC